MSEDSVRKALFEREGERERELWKVYSSVNDPQIKAEDVLIPAINFTGTE